MRKILVVVMGYGCEFNENMRLYLNTVADFLVENHEVCGVILTGGFTNRKSCPGISEAGMMETNLRLMGVEQIIFLDEKARTTMENINGVKRFILEEDLDEEEILIFCDSSRSLKIKILAYWILGEWVETKKIDLTQGLFKKLKQLLIYTPFDLLAALFPSLEKLQLKRKEWIMDRS
jgi:hypothetical protein